ncbi:hypothetical protein KL86SPO_70595 [uncultured Sporomusa sp.]|uniref:Uncharacterized protein n=1 Tax=uncultured Sporomusa sp. TaxID=307249 RepID=A0A212M1W2_9FIRM|nr:hypothetical protein KL86SPO_70595 [uncultured Sporomusa sp.]
MIIDVVLMRSNAAALRLSLCFAIAYKVSGQVYIVSTMVDEYLKNYSN